ncbi:MAG: response regulator [Endomicrobia bacterium]|nr:response regulator [Endomicrobiia bacterium]
MHGKILIVDDEIEILGFLPEIIERHGFNVVALDSGKKAIDVLEKNFFHIALLDINLPDISGTEIAEKIKCLYPLTFIVMMTAGASQKEIEKLKSLGVFEILFKPINLQKISEIIQKIMIKLSEMQQNKDILLIEDDEYLAKTIVTILKMNSYNVTVAQTGEQAIEECKRKYFRVVIADYKLPTISGIETVREIKKFNKNSAYIIVTGYEEFSIAVSAIKEGVNDFILKPIDCEVLLQILSKFFTSNI